MGVIRLKWFRNMPEQEKYAPGKDTILQQDDFEAAERLRNAIERAGGTAEVARRARLPQRSLYNFLKGREMRRSALVALSNACGVSIDWLATGTEPKLPGEPAHATIADASGNEVEVSFHRQAIVEQRGLFETVDISLLASAIDKAQDALRVSNRKLPTIELARAIVILYDLMKSGNDADL